MLFDRLNRYIYHFLGLKELLIEIFIQVMHTCLMLKRHRLRWGEHFAVWARCFSG